jgi:hypothetical protein
VTHLISTCAALVHHVLGLKGRETMKPSKRIPMWLTIDVAIILVGMVIIAGGIWITNARILGLWLSAGHGFVLMAERYWPSPDASAFPCPFLSHIDPPHHSLVNEAVLSAHEVILKQSKLSLFTATRGDTQMTILKIAIICVVSAGTLVAFLSTGFGSDVALVVVSII